MTTLPKRLFNDICQYIEKEHTHYETEIQFDKDDIYDAYNKGENHFSYNENYNLAYDDESYYYKDDILADVKEHFKETFEEKELDIDEYDDELNECIDCNWAITYHEECEDTKFFVLPYANDDEDKFLFRGHMDFEWYFEDKDRHEELMFILDKLQVNPRAFAQTYIENYEVSDDFEVNWEWFPDMPERNPYVNTGDLIDEMQNCPYDGWLTALMKTDTIETFYHENKYIRIPEGTTLCIFNYAEGSGSIASLELIRDWYVERDEALVKIEGDRGYDPQSLYDFTDSIYTEFSCVKEKEGMDFEEINNVIMAKWYDLPEEMRKYYMDRANYNYINKDGLPAYPTIEKFVLGNNYRRTYFSDMSNASIGIPKEMVSKYHMENRNVLGYFSTCMMKDAFKLNIDRWNWLEKMKKTYRRD